MAQISIHIYKDFGAIQNQKPGPIWRLDASFFENYHCTNMTISSFFKTREQARRYKKRILRCWR